MADLTYDRWLAITHEAAYIEGWAQAAADQGLDLSGQLNASVVRLRAALAEVRPDPLAAVAALSALEAGAVVTGG